MQLQETLDYLQNCLLSSNWGPVEELSNLGQPCKRTPRHNQRWGTWISPEQVDYKNAMKALSMDWVKYWAHVLCISINSRFCDFRRWGPKGEIMRGCAYMKLLLMKALLTSPGRKRTAFRLLHSFLIFHDLQYKLHIVHEGQTRCWVSLWTHRCQIGAPQWLPLWTPHNDHHKQNISSQCVQRQWACMHEVIIF